MRTLLLMVLALALSWGSAGAEGEGEPDAARAAFADGNTEFELGHFREAAAAWERGYKLKPDPVFLYNIAQAYRQADVPDKALFFYRGYLRALPDASNRAQVEERMAQLERTLVERANAPSGSAAAAASSSSATAPAPASSSDAGTPSPATPSVAARAHDRSRRADVEVGLGVAAWAAGVPAGTSPSLLVTVGGGYAVARRGRLELRLGGLASYTFLHDVSATDHFLGLHGEARLRVRLVRRRLFADGSVALGAQIVTGLAPGSPLLPAHASGGTAAAFALRPALALELRATELLAFRGGVALAYSPLPLLASPSLIRVELALSALLRF